MAEYISREAFLADKKWLYCTDCEKRKGKKRGKMVTLYKIGEAPCKSCGIHDMLEEVEDYPAADVREVKRGKWILFDIPKNMVMTNETPLYSCSECSAKMSNRTNYCPNCGADMREEEQTNGM